MKEDRFAGSLAIVQGTLAIAAEQCHMGKGWNHIILLLRHIIRENYNLKFYHYNEFISLCHYGMV